MDSSRPSDQPSIHPSVYQHLLFDYVRENRATLLVYLLVIFFTLPVETVVLPQFYSRLLGQVGQHIKSLTAFTANPWSQMTQGTAAGWLLWIAVIWVVVVLAYIAKNSFEATIVPTYMSFIRQRLFTGTVNKHADDYKDLRVGEEVTRILDISRNMRDLMIWVTGELVPLYAATVVMVGYLLWNYPTIGAVLATGAVVHTACFLWMGQQSVNLSATREHYYLQMSEKLHDSLGNLMNVYLNNMKGSEIRKNKQVEALHTELLVKQFQHTRNTVAMLSFISILTFFVTIGFLYEQTRAGAYSGTTFTAIWLIALLYLSNLLRLSDYIPFYLTKLGIVQCSNDFLLGLLEKRSARTVKRAVTKGHIKFEDVEFAYPGGAAPILTGFHLEVQPGEKVGILGTSGSGKTTAMKLLSGMYTPTSGLLQIDGHSVHTIDLQHLRRRIVYINQRTQMFNTSILKNIQYGNKVSAKEVGELLKRYELDAVYAKLPEGVYTNAGVNGGSLSLGMQKVTMLMRGLLRDGTVVVLDEPLAGLDAATRVKVMRLIKDRCAGKTTLVITHDKEIIPYMDRTVNISEINRAAKPARSDGQAARDTAGEGYTNPLATVVEAFTNWLA